MALRHESAVAVAIDRETLRTWAREELASWRWVGRPKQLAPLSHTRTLISGGRGSGKALALDTPLPTPTGWTTMGAVRVGDELLDWSGRPCRVTAATDVQLNRCCRRMTFDDGTAVVCDIDHLWVTWDKRARKALGRAALGFPAVRSTAEIERTLLHPRPDGRPERNHAVATVMPLALPEGVLPLDPYVLGVWLGDGSKAAATITMGDGKAAVLTAVAEAGIALRAYVTPGRVPTYAMRLATGDSVHRILRSLGVLGDKHIPAEYLRASARQRLAILQGLMDTDGGGSPESSRVEVTTVRPRLAEDIAELVVSLGMKAWRDERPAMLDGRQCGTAYRVTFTPTMPVFRLPRKAELVRFDTGQQTRRHRRYIRCVTRVPSVPVRCITVDSPSQTYLCTRSMVPTHNTRAGAETLAEWAWTQPETEWCVVAPTYGHARSVCVEGRKSGLLRALGGVGGRKVEKWNRSTGEIVLANGSLIVVDGADDGAPSIQGHNLAGGWVDEIGLWSLRRWQQAWHESIVFATREGSGQMVATGTPKQGHPLVRLLLEDAGWHKVTMTTGENVANLSADVVAELEQRYGGTRLGRQELLGEFLEDVPGALWTIAMIDAGRAPLPVREHRGVVLPDLARVVVAVDPAATSGEESDETGIVAVGLGADGDCYVLDDRSCRMSPDGWGRRVVQCYHDMQADAVVAETNQGGEMVLHVLRTVAPTLPVKLIHASRGKRLRAEPVSALYEQGRVHHVVPLPKLEDQMVRWTPEGGVRDDRLDALVYAVTELALGDHGVPRVRVIADESEREGWSQWA